MNVVSLFGFIRTTLGLRVSTTLSSDTRVAERMAASSDSNSITRACFALAIDLQRVKAAGRSKPSAAPTTTCDRIPTVLTQAAPSHSPTPSAHTMEVARGGGEPQPYPERAHDVGSAGHDLDGPFDDPERAVGDCGAEPFEERPGFLEKRKRGLPAPRPGPNLRPSGLEPLRDFVHADSFPLLSSQRTSRRCRMTMTTSSPTTRTMLILPHGMLSQPASCSDWAMMGATAPIDSGAKS